MFIVVVSVVVLEGGVVQGVTEDWPLLIAILNGLLCWVTVVVLTVVVVVPEVVVAAAVTGVAVTAAPETLAGLLISGLVVSVEVDIAAASDC